MPDIRQGEVRVVEGETEPMTLDEIREQIMGSDLYSPSVKKAMRYFWARCDELKGDKTDA